MNQRWWTKKGQKYRSLLYKIDARSVEAIPYSSTSSLIKFWSVFSAQTIETKERMTLICLKWMMCNRCIGKIFFFFAVAVVWFVPPVHLASLLAYLLTNAIYLFVFVARYLRGQCFSPFFALVVCSVWLLLAYFTMFEGVASVYIDLHSWAIF